MIVDDMHHNHPELLKDMHWNESVPINLPYTEETQHYRKEEPKGSAEQREEDDSNYQVCTQLPNSYTLHLFQSEHWEQLLPR